LLRPRRPSPADKTRDRDFKIRRQVAMKCVAQLTAAAIESNGDARADWVFPLADKILAWLEQCDT
jgi:hypothetical protein